MQIEVPGYKVLNLKYLVLDYNGTIAVDGRMPESIQQRIIVLSKELMIYVLTADTHGTVEDNCRE